MLPALSEGKFDGLAPGAAYIPYSTPSKNMEMKVWLSQRPGNKAKKWKSMYAANTKIA